MQAHAQQHHKGRRRVVVVVGVVLAVALTSGAYYEAARIDHLFDHTHPEAPVATPTPHAPLGRKWFYEYPLWQQPEQAQP